jgi:hypothetical protein
MHVKGPSPIIGERNFISLSAALKLVILRVAKYFCSSPFSPIPLCWFTHNRGLTIVGQRQAVGRIPSIGNLTWQAVPRLVSSNKRIDSQWHQFLESPAEEEIAVWLGWGFAYDKTAWTIWFFWLQAPRRVWHLARLENESLCRLWQCQWESCVYKHKWTSDTSICGIGDHFDFVGQFHTS